jgi:hypothetical protein
VDPVVAADQAEVRVKQPDSAQTTARPGVQLRALLLLDAGVTVVDHSYSAESEKIRA